MIFVCLLGFLVFFLLSGFLFWLVGSLGFCLVCCHCFVLTEKTKLGNTLITSSVANSSSSCSGSVLQQYPLFAEQISII